MRNGLPRVSVVTPCLNRAGMVAAAVDSVVAQGYPRVEHVIADGGSTDGTLDVLATPTSPLSAARSPVPLSRPAVG